MRTFFIISLTFLAALLLEILPIPNWAIWVKPAWVALTLIFWILLLPYRVGMMVAFVVGLLMDLLMGTLLGEHSVIFVLIAYVILRFHVRIRLSPWWQQSAIIFVLILLGQAFLSWVSGFIGGFRAEAWFWLPALSSAIVWPWVYAVLNMYTNRYKIHEIK